MTQIVNYTLPLGDRISMRENLITTFLQEAPGEGNGEKASRYHYNVEQLGNYGIYLKRPTQLNKGFDFTVNISGLFFKNQRRYSNPSHSDIMDALSNCKLNYPHIYPDIAQKLNQIYECEAISTELTGATFHDFENNEHPIEIISLAVKWLSLEQDCAYWHYSGRAMLYMALCENGLI